MSGVCLPWGLTSIRTSLEQHSTWYWRRNSQGSRKERWAQQVTSGSDPQKRGNLGQPLVLDLATNHGSHFAHLLRGITVIPITCTSQRKDLVKML